MSRDPGTFWLINGHRYQVDSAGRYVNIETGRLPLASLDDRYGVQLHLVPLVATEAAAAQAVQSALREAATQWRPFIADQRCPTCQMGPSRETTGLVCQTCGTDYGRGDQP